MTFFSVLILTTALPADWTSGTKSGTTGAACAEKTNDMTQHDSNEWQHLVFVQHVKNSFIPYVGTVSVKLFPS